MRDDYGKLWFNIVDYTGSATRLFADPAFDGDPVRITEEQLAAAAAGAQELHEEEEPEFTNETPVKYLHLSPRDLSALSLQRGDILVNRTNSAELVGMCAVFEIEGDFSFASYLIRLRLDRQRAEPRLMAAYINSPLGRAYMLNEKRQMTGQANVNSTKLKSLPVALPPLPEQRTIVAELEALSGEVKALQHMQLGTAAQLNALLPAILDRAFNGEP